MRKPQLYVVSVLLALVGCVVVMGSDPIQAASMVGPPVPPVIDTSPPDEPMKLVFIHASVGWMWLGHWLGGRDDVPAYWDISLGGNNYYVSDAPPLPGFTGHGYCDWYYIFTNEEHLQALFEYNGVMSNYDPIADPGGENEIIMIKPCFTEYPVLGAPDDPPSGNPGCNPGMNTVGNVKQVMVDILEVFRQHPDKFFVLVTAPPKPEGAMTNGENARAIANWMVNEWLDGYDVGNVMVFDLYNVLTSNGEGEGDACQEWSDPGNPESGSDVGQETGNHHRIWNGQVQHQVAYEQTYSAYCGDGHPPRQATYKATVEFVPLLNAYVNAWMAGQDLSAESPVAPTRTALPTPTMTEPATPTAAAVQVPTVTSTVTPLPATASIAAPTPTALPVLSQEATAIVTLTHPPSAVSAVLATETPSSGQRPDDAVNHRDESRQLPRCALALGVVPLFAAVALAVKVAVRRS